MTEITSPEIVDGQHGKNRQTIVAGGGIPMGLLHLHSRCCKKCGCFYSERDCPVVSGKERPGPCRKCLRTDIPDRFAYEAALAALWRHREGEEKLAAANKALATKNKELRDTIRLLRKRAAADRRKQTKHF